MRITTKIIIENGKHKEEEEFSLLIGTGKWTEREIDGLIDNFVFRSHLKRCLEKVGNNVGIIYVE